MSDPVPTLVDVHAHFVTDKYIAAAKAAGKSFAAGKAHAVADFPGQSAQRRAAGGRPGLWQ